MARIVYKPHCSNCGARIREKVTWEREQLDLKNPAIKRIGKDIVIVHPYRCKACGAYFDCIEFTPPKEVTTE